MSAFSCDRCSSEPRAAKAMLVAAMLAAAAPLHAQSPSIHLLVVTGAGGDAEYKARFLDEGATLARAATTRLGLPAANVTWLAEDSTRAGASGRSSRDGVQRALAALAGRARGDDRVVVVLIGHGSSTGGQARFNLPGPDVTAAEMRTMLEPFGARTVAVVNASSASGDWVKALSGPNRVVVTATKSGSEGNATTFAGPFVRALAEGGADVDKDGATSLLEAYDFARREVERAYESDNRLLTEHAMLDDDGDGKGTAAPAARGTGDGALARRILFRAGGSAYVAAAATTSNDPRLAPLLARRDSLQQRVEALRARKATMAEAAYQDELERLMLSLAGANKAIRDAGRAP